MLATRKQSRSRIGDSWIRRRKMRAISPSSIIEREREREREREKRVRSVNAPGTWTSLMSSEGDTTSKLLITAPSSPCLAHHGDADLTPSPPPFDY